MLTAIVRTAKVTARFTYRQARRLVIGVIGGTVLLAGIVLLFTPGPAMVVIPVGLLILATEFIWARRWLNKIRDGVSNAKSRVFKR